MRSIFLSYRRDDSEGEAGRLFDDLVGHFGQDSVFMDVAAIEPGRDFRKAIDESVATCGVLLAVIGREWTEARNEAGQRRLDDPFDFVRLETASALKRDIPVIPVLVHGAKMPRSDQLPDGLKELAFRNGVELTHARWNSDLQLLIKALRAHVEDPTKMAGRETTTRVSDEGKIAPVEAVINPAGRKRFLWAILALVLGIGGAFAMLTLRPSSNPRVEDSAAAQVMAEQKAMADKLAAEKTWAEQAEQAAADKAAAERAEAEKVAAERQALADKLAAEKAEAEKAEQAAADKAAAERAEAEKVAAEQKAQADKLAAEKAEKAAAEKTAAAKAAAAKKKALAEKAAADKAAAKRTEAEKAAAEEVAAERAAAEQKARADKAAADRAAAQAAAEIFARILDGGRRESRRRSEDVTVPVARRVPDKAGFVYSPFQEGSVIDVRGVRSGTVTNDPGSGKAFRVP